MKNNASIHSKKHFLLVQFTFKNKKLPNFCSFSPKIWQRVAHRPRTGGAYGRPQRWRDRGSPSIDGHLTLPLPSIKPGSIESSNLRSNQQDLITMRIRVLGEQNFWSFMFPYNSCFIAFSSTKCQSLSKFGVLCLAVFFFENYLKFPKKI